MAISTSQREADNVMFGKHTFEKVQKYNYLGSEVNNSNNMHEGITYRISAGNREFYMIKN